MKIGRIVYAIVGLAGVYAAYFMITQGQQFWDNMGVLGGIGYVLLEIGGINWGIKAVVGKDLFELIKQA